MRRAAPASTPQVGWSTTRSFGSRMISRPTTNFCRFPPESLRACGSRSGVRTSKARKLSGGNLQKFVVGREIIREPKLLVVDQPTWGVDAGAARLIRQALVDLAARGAAVLVVSQDLDELFEIADRLAVIHDGRLSEPRPTGAWTRDAIGLEMMGVAHAA